MEINDYNRLAEEYDLSHKKCSMCRFFTQYDAWACCHLYNKSIWFKSRAKKCVAFNYVNRDVGKHYESNIL